MLYAAPHWLWLLSVPPQHRWLVCTHAHTCRAPALLTLQRAGLLAVLTLKALCASSGHRSSGWDTGPPVDSPHTRSGQTRKARGPWANIQ